VPPCEWLCDIASGALSYNHDGRACDVQECPSLYAACRPGESVWVDSNGTSGKPTFRRRANLSWLSAICEHYGEIAAWSRKSREHFQAKVAFLEKKTPYGQIFKNVFQKDSWRHRFTSCVQILWNFAERKLVKSCVIYLTKKTKFWLALPLLLLRGSCPKSARASSRQYTPSAPNFIQIHSLPAELQPDAWTSLKRAIRCFQYSAKLQLLRRVMSTCL